MGNCNHCRDVLLDLLYGLLDPAAEQDIRAHLASCSDCQNAFEEAKREQNLFARAAHIFRQVPVFLPPEDGVPAGPVPAVEPRVLEFAPRVRKPWRRWAPVAVAAAVLLAVVGLTGLYRSRVHRYEMELADAQKRVEEADQHFAQVHEFFQKEQAQLPRKVQGRVMHLQVMGPARHDSDAPTPVRVLTHDSTGRPVAAQVIATVTANDKELYRTKISTTGDGTFTLPAGILKRSTPAELMIEAMRGEAVAHVKETVKAEEPTLVTQLTTNKSVYQTGEVILFRTLTLKRFSAQPPDEPVLLNYSLRDSTGRVQRKDRLQVGPGGISGGELSLPPNLLTGEYTLEVSGAAGAKVVPQQRRLMIVRDLPPQVVFDRANYHPGQTIKAVVKAGRRAGSKAPKQVLQVQAQIDGKKLAVNGSDSARPVEVRTDDQGSATLEIKLPPAIANGKGEIVVQVPEQAKLVQPIPLAGARLSVEFFPEGGDLVAGVPNRVYYRVRNEQGEPVDPLGRLTILDQDNKVVLDAEQKQSLGIFQFVPDLNNKYRLKLTHPLGISQAADPFKDIPLRAHAVSMSVPDSVAPEGKSLRVVLQNTGDNLPLLLVATCRGQVVGERFSPAGQGEQEVHLDLVDGTRGMVRLTLYRADGDNLSPLAERLIYRIPAERLALSIKNLKESYKAGEKLKWLIETVTEVGTKTPAWLLAAVVDEKVLRDADSRTASPPTHFYLTSELRRPQDLDNAEILLRDTPEARQALDLFLGTQGWRRFVPASDAPAYARKDTPSADKANSLAMFNRENASPAKLLALADTDLRSSLSKLRQDVVRQRARLEEDRKKGLEQAASAAASLSDLQNLPALYVRTGAGILVIGLLLVGGVCLTIGLLRMLRRTLSATNAFAGAFGTLAACLVLYLASGALPQPDGAGAQDLVAKLAGVTWPGVPEQPSVPAGKAWSTPGLVGLFALAVPSTRSQTEASGESRIALTPELRERLLNSDNLPVAAAVATPIAPIRIIMPSPPQMPQKGTQPVHVTPVEVVRTPLRAIAHPGSDTPSLADTLLWHPLLFANDGTAEVSFGLPGNTTSYRVLLYGNSPSGRLGVFQARIQVRR